MPKLYSTQDLADMIETSKPRIRYAIRKLNIRHKKQEGTTFFYTFADLKRLSAELNNAPEVKEKVKIDLGKPEDFIPNCFLQMESDEELFAEIQRTEREIQTRKAALA